DNLPPALLPQLADHGNGRMPRVAVVVDVRAGEGLEDLEPVLHTLKSRKGEEDLEPVLYRLSRRKVDTTILFLEASDPVLVNRFKETRRKHPLLLEAGGILPSLQREGGMLTGLEDARGQGI